eukprot:278805-Alexandrium_andersonii.AAC.1
MVKLRALQLGYLGHVLRRGPGDPLWGLCFDRFLAPRILGGPRRRGLPRLKWAREVLAFAYLEMGRH